MSVRREYVSPYLTDRNQIIRSYRKTLEPLINSLSVDSRKQPAPEAKGSTPNSLELDQQIEGFLTFVGARFCLWIFADIANSTSLQTDLWVSFFAPVVNVYRSDIIGSKHPDPNVGKLATKRFDRLCKHISYFYKLFITRLIENHGYTPQLHYAVSILHLIPDVPRVNPTPATMEKNAPILHRSVHDCLCHMGDLSRYRTINMGTLDYTHAVIYFNAAFKIYPVSGVPLNQLGNISYATSDIFSAAYYFIQSVTVAEPFPDDNANLRTILKKLLKLKPPGFAKLRIAGIIEMFGANKSANEFGDESSLAIIAEDEDGKEDTKIKKGVAETKEVMMLILQLYSSYYMAHVSPGKSVYFSESMQIELARKLSGLVRSKLVTSKLLLKLAIITILFVHLIEKDNQVKDQTDSNDSTTAHFAILSLTLRILDNLVSVALELADDSGVILTGRRVKPAIVNMLPAFRVYFDWIRKQVSRKKIAEWSLDNPLVNDLLPKIACLLEHFLTAFGFKFDVVTAVNRSMWDRFNDILKLQEETFPTNGNATGTETDETSSIWREAQTKKNQKERLLYDNEEENQCAGMCALYGGLDDTPSGLASVTRKQRAALEAYRVQCLLFTGVEISRLTPSFLELNEFAGDAATFKFIGMDSKSAHQLSQSLEMVLTLAPSDEGQLDDMFDETELYDLVGRGAILSQQHGEAESDELDRNPMFMAHSEPELHMAHASSASQYLRQLEVESAGSVGRSSNPSTPGPNPMSSDEEEETDKVTPEAVDGQSDESDESDEEEIVFSGRGRTAK